MINWILECIFKFVDWLLEITGKILCLLDGHNWGFKTCRDCGKVRKIWVVPLLGYKTKSYCDACHKVISRKTAKEHQKNCPRIKEFMAL